MYYMYKVCYYDSYSDEEKYGKGIVCATNYGTAADRVIHSYGEDNVLNLFLKEMMTSSMDDKDYCLSEEDIKSVFEEE